MNILKNNKFASAAIVLYAVYFLHGIQSIILAQNAEFLAGRWGTTTAEIFNVIAWVGIGKIVFLSISGPLSDRFGRKPMAMIGLAGYVTMFAIYFFGTSLPLAYVASFIGGGMTSLFDGAIYPAYMEIFPDNKSTSSILNKASISISSILYPIFVGFVSTSQVSNLWVLAVPLVMSIIVFIALSRVTLPDGQIKKDENVTAQESIKILESRQHQDEATSIKKVNEGKFKIDGVLIVLFSFFIYSTFYLFQQVVSIYASDVVNMGEVAARSLTSYYQMGSLVAVFASAFFMARGIRDIALLVIYPAISAVMALIIFIEPNVATLTIGSIVIGFTAAGGALQLGNALLNSFIDTNKGRNTSMYYFSMSIGSYVMPTIAAQLQQTNFSYVMLLVSAVGFVAAILMAILTVRYKHVFGTSAFSRQK